MDWASGLRWRKAMVISLLLHSVVLTGLGYLAAKAMQAEPVPETLIELELTNEAEALPLANEQQLAIPGSAVSDPKMPQSAPNQPPTASETVIAEPVVTASTMSVVAVDNAAIVAADGGTAGGSDASDPASGGASGGSQSSGGSATQSREIIPPGILSNPPPVYPEQARRAGIVGTVILRIEILENGRAGEVSVSQSSGSDLLDDAAVEAVQHWLFTPAKVRGTGQSIACQTKMPVKFRLNK